jgi:thioesterase domain-containing protein
MNFKPMTWYKIEQATQEQKESKCLLLFESGGYELGYWEIEGEYWAWVEDGIIYRINPSHFAMLAPPDGEKQ